VRNERIGYERGESDALETGLLKLQFEFFGLAGWQFLFEFDKELRDQTINSAFTSA
jgi:hypothetical protein